MRQFKLDKFQEEAIEFASRDFSVIVSAPTGSGKTLIAEYVIEKSMAEGKGAIYTAPIKALSNQKFRDFQKLYGDKVGILTGDVSINPEADILIMTTEIYRNTLFEEGSEKIKNKKWVIFDEIHYIDNLERGTVWEESIIFSPKEIRILALSATIPNIRQLAAWIKKIREEEIEVITEEKRPVPLVHRFQCCNRIYDSFKKLNECYIICGHKSKGRRKTKYPRNRTKDIIKHIEQNQELPCIFFAFGRKRCEELASKSIKFNFLNEREKKEATELYRNYIEKFDISSDKTAKEMYQYIKKGIAYHHAGILPALKEIIERLFTAGLIKLIFTTETFALGINMPARSVVFDELRKFYGYAFDYLTTRDFYQMAGRSGRRGMDETGYVYSRINPRRISIKTLKKIITGRPEKVMSQFNAAYAVILNLYSQMGEELIQIYPKSFHFFQTNQKQRKAALENIKNKIRLLKHLGYIDEKGITSKGQFASHIYGYELPLSELFIDGFFENHTVEEIACVLSAVTYEPRKGYEFIPDLPENIIPIRKITRKLSKKIFKNEVRFKLDPISPRFHYHLSSSIIQWILGVEFENLPCLEQIDEGEVVRNFRMVIQLARELINTPGCSPIFYEKMSKLLKAMKRDVVDAEKQLGVTP